MPFDYGLRLDNRQRIANARAKPIQSVDGAEGLFLRSGLPQNVYLLPQHPNFCLKRRPRPDQIDDHQNKEPDKISHHATASPDSRSTASQIGFATGTMETVVISEGDFPGGSHRHVHTVTVGDLIQFLTWFQLLKRYVGEHRRPPPHVENYRKRAIFTVRLNTVKIGIFLINFNILDDTWSDFWLKGA
jgi:hypothetical protein